MPVKEWALAYAKLGWPVFRITGYKTPLKNSHGHLDATTDPAIIDAWWTEKPHCNVALACGDIVVIDADGSTALERLRQIMKANGGAPHTAVVQTARGLHFYFRAPAGAHIRTRNAPREKSGDDGIDIKAHGGWIVLPPSINAKSRFTYKWLAPLPIAELPMWLIDSLIEIPDNPKQIDFAGLGPLPEHLRAHQQNAVIHSAVGALRTIWSPSEQARLISALQAIPVKTCGYDDFLRIGFALHSLDWQRSDGTSIAFDLWNEWCAQSEHHNQAGLESKWQSFERSARGEISIATVYHMAKARGWNGGAPAPLIGNGGAETPPASSNQFNGHANGVNGHQALPAPFGGQQAIFFPDLNEDRQPKATCANASVAVQALDIQCRKDLFHEKMLVAGHAIDAWAGDMSDDVVQMIRKTIRFRFGFDPKAENVRDACVQLCLEHQFDPVLDYLDGLRWDGVPRLASWLQRYMGAPDTDLNRTIGQLVLIAAVRRARDPGAKFDQIVVFESVEGRGKSSAIEVLAGSENFSDQNILGLSGKEQQEAMAGIWLYEIADLTGMKRAEIEHVKAFASRKVDRARPAYGRFRVDRARRTIFFATTNDDEYLKSQTGNRRIWPVVIGKIDLEALRQDRDQLWAEAARLEADGRSIALPEHLWDAAAAEQNQRTESDEWSAAIHNFLEMPEKPRCDVSIMEALAENQFLQVERSRVGRAEQMRAGAILRRMGFVKYRKRLAGNAFEWRYRRNGEQL